MSMDLSIGRAGEMRAGPSASAGTQAASGTLFGSAAAVADDPMSLLADAAEELTFAVDGTEDCEAEDRAEEQEDVRNERLRALLKKILEHDGRIQAVNELHDHLGSQQEGRREAMRMLRRFFPDPTESWLVLTMLLDDLEKPEGGDPKAAGRVRELMADLEAAEGPALRAGLRGMENAAGFEDLGTPTELGALYRKAVLDFSGIEDLYAHVLEKCGGSFDAGADFISKALGADLASDAPSADRAHLEYVNANLGRMRSLRSAHAICERMLARWADVHGVAGCPVKDMDLLGAVVALRGESFISPDRFARLAEKAGADNPERKVLFLQELLSAARSLPPVLFDGNEGRMRVIDAVQDAVDAAVDAEDAWLAQQDRG